MNNVIDMADWVRSHAYFICPDSTDEIERIARRLIYEESVCVDFSRLSDKAVMKMLYFLSGVTYAMNGSVIQVSPFKYVFC